MEAVRNLHAASTEEEWDKAVFEFRGLYDPAKEALLINATKMRASDREFRSRMLALPLASAPSSSTPGRIILSVLLLEPKMFSKAEYRRLIEEHFFPNRDFFVNFLLPRLEEIDPDSAQVIKDRMHPPVVRG